MTDRRAHPRPRIVAATALGLLTLLLGTPAGALADGTPTAAAGPAPVATTPPLAAAAPAPIVLQAVPADPSAGQSVQIEVTGGPANATDFRWQLPGAAVATVDTGSQPKVTTSFLTPGVHAISVTVAAPAGPSTATLNLAVAPAPAPITSVATTTTTSTTTSTTESRTVTRSATASSTTAAVHAVARAASDPGVSIVDFSFSPGTTTIHVGDTITWTNTGQQPHTATANNGGFDTGLLRHGQSASHTFTQAGTFTYYCTVHPYMKGTVVVLASSSSSSSSSPSAPAASASSGSTGSTGASTPSTAATTASSGSSLPLTGMNVWGAVLLGGLMLIAGGGLRLLSWERESASGGPDSQSASR